MGIFEVYLFIFIIAISFSFSSALGPIIIPILRRLKFGQTIRSEGPASHYKKEGTPTMGGILFIIAASLTSLGFYFYFSNSVYQHKGTANIVFLLFALVSYGFLGFLDDYIKVVLKRNLGLSAKHKLIGQLIIGLVLFWVLLEVRVAPLEGYYIFALKIPFIEAPLYLNWQYLPLLLFIIIGTSNATNLTDGLDGLLSTTAIIAYSTYAVIGVWQNNIEVCIFSLAIVGALLGFLLFNFYPAKIIMGDVGSLALGGGLAGLAVITSTELLLPIIGGVFVIETLSVIIQVTSFKLRQKRVFRMSPIHHHFELIGWSEKKVVGFFFLASLVLSMLSLYIYKIFYWI